MLKFTNRRTIETYSYKYITIINGKKFEILSNFGEDVFTKLLTELSKKWDEIKTFEVKECIEFQYTNENDGVKLDTLRNYL